MEKLKKAIPVIYTHPKLPYFVKHVDGKLYVHCDLSGEPVKARRSWSSTLKEQKHIISDASKLCAVDNFDIL